MRLIASTYGNGKVWSLRVVEWDSDTLNDVLATLRHERQTYRHRYFSDNSADTAGLLFQAEKIKDNANQILEVDATQ